MNGCTEPQDTARFRNIVTRQLGLSLDSSSPATLHKALLGRAKARGQTVAAYIDCLETQRAPDEIAELACRLTIGETYFFRDANQFRALTERVLPDRLGARAPNAPIKILSAGCATGEEPFSIAVAILDMPSELRPHVSIQAVDVNSTALQRASQGRFSPWALRTTPTAIRDKWFTQSEGKFGVRADARSAVQFRHANLAEDNNDIWQPEAYDIIFCRNVLMYFAEASKVDLVERIHRALAPGGFLFLGHAETLRGISEDFHVVSSHGTFYYRRKDRNTGRAAAQWDDQTLPMPATQSPTAFTGDADWFPAIGRASRRIAALSQRVVASANRRPSARQMDIGMVFALIEQGQFAEALDALRALPPESRDEPAILLVTAALLLHQGDLVAAQADCQRLIDTRCSADAHYILALCCEGTANHIEARERYRLASSLDPTFAMPWLHSGMSARRVGQREVARDALQRALTLMPAESASRIRLFGGGFTRQALVALCRAQYATCESAGYA
jgi:chemotaxis protein methyltransferase CheR